MTAHNNKQNDGDDNSLFREALGDGTRPFSSPNRVEHEQLPVKPNLRPPEPSAVKTNDMLSDNGEIEKVDEHTILDYCTSGIQTRLFRRLRRGKIPVTEELDLHGLGLQQAREVMLEFLEYASPLEGSCAILVHGKGNRSMHRQGPILKRYINHWLQQHPRVLAFHSAQPKDGGTGAVYMLLRRFQ